MKALSIRNLTKVYANGLQALRGINLDIKQGDYFALLGPNGAGKTTTIGILTSLVTKTSGKVEIFGHDIDTDFEKAKECIGVVPQEFNFNIFDTVENVIIDQAGYYGIPRILAKQRAEKYLKQLDLWNKRHSIGRFLSGGMKRRLMIARALVHEPTMLVLDEPTAGVDVELRRSMWDFLRQLNKQGITIILTTHYLEEAESQCRNIAIINQGIITENTSMKSLLSKLDFENLILTLKTPLTKIPQIPPCEITPLDSLTLEVIVPHKFGVNRFFQELSFQNIEVLSLRNKVGRLEELFIRLTK